MKRSGPVNNSSSDTELTIEQLPHELLNIVFLKLGFSFKDLANLRLVNKLWKTRLDKLIKELVLPFLPDGLPHEKNPLALLNNEYLYYKTYFPNIDFMLIYAALEGKEKYFAALVDVNLKIQLQSICFAINGNEGVLNLDADKFEDHVPSLGFVIAAGKGQLEFIRKYRYKLFAEGFRVGYLRAAQHGHFEIIQCLDEQLDSLRFENIFVYMKVDLYAEGLSLACEQGNLQLVGFFVTKENLLDDFARENAYCKAAKAGHLNVLQLLSETLHYQNEVYMWHALKAAIIHGRVNVVQYLYPKVLQAFNYFVLDENELHELDEAFISAARHGHEPTIAYLIKAHTFEYKTIVHAVNGAIEAGQVVIFNFLCSKVVKKQQMENSILIASELGHVEMIQAVALRKWIHRAVIDKAFVNLALLALRKALNNISHVTAATRAKSDVLLSSMELNPAFHAFKIGEPKSLQEKDQESSTIRDEMIKKKGRL